MSSPCQTCKAWKTQQLWVEKARLVGGSRNGPEQMPEAKALRKKLERVSGTRLITVHSVISCVFHDIFAKRLTVLHCKEYIVQR